MVAINKPSSILPTIPHSPSLSWMIAHAFNVFFVGCVISAANGFEDATEAMSFYGVYHQEPLNQLIHFFGIPMIQWSAFLAQAHLPLTTSVTIPALPFMPAHHPSWATFTALFYAISYLNIDFFGAVVYDLVIYAFYASAVSWVQRDQQTAAKSASKSWVGSGRMLQLALAMQVFAWYMQIHPGHAIVEGGKPALLDSLGAALYSAPLFSFYEGIWFVGLRQEHHASILKLVADNTRELCKQGLSIKACAQFTS